MLTKITPVAFCVAALFTQTVQAADEHSSPVFHAIKLELAGGENRDHALQEWDLDGWVGGDENKLWLKSEGERVNDETENSENWLLYSLNVDMFWDAQAGIRYDNKPESVSYAVFGFNGLAPYHFETAAHFFVSDEGDISMRIREENDFLITQRLILQPYAEVNLFAQDVKELDVGSGLSSGEIGLQLRYEITRKFSPYMDLHYEHLFSETADIANANNERSRDVVATLGLRLMF